MLYIHMPRFPWPKGSRGWQKLCCIGYILECKTDVYNKSWLWVYAGTYMWVTHLTKLNSPVTAHCQTDVSCSVYEFMLVVVTTALEILHRAFIRISPTWSMGDWDWDSRVQCGGSLDGVFQKGHRRHLNLIAGELFVWGVVPYREVLDVHHQRVYST